MKAFSYDRYNPDRPMNKLRKLVKQPIPQTIFTANEMEQVKLAFETASDLPQYYVNMIRPAWRSAMAEALPNLIDRQLVSIVRDFGDVNLAELERSYRKKLEKARAELASAEVGGTPEDILVAEENVKAWEKRLDGVTGHKALHRKPMSPRVAYLLKSLEGTFDVLFTAAAANHIVGATAILDDFLPRVYGRGPQLIKAQKFFKEQMPLNKKNPHSFARVFETLVEAHAWG